MRRNASDGGTGDACGLLDCVGGGCCGSVQAEVRAEESVRAPVSKWGIALQMPSFSLVCAYVRPAGFEKSWPSLVVFVVGAEIRVWAYIPLIR